MSEAMVPVYSSGAGESSNSLNDRTAVRIDAAIHAAIAIAGTSTKFDVPRPTGRFDAVGRGGGGGGGDDNCGDDVVTRRGSNSGGSGGSLASGGSEASTNKSSALVTKESKKATTEARLDAAIKAALVIHATDRSSSSGSSTFQGSYRGGGHAGSSLALAAPPRRGGGGGGGMLTVYQPPAPPRVQGRYYTSRESGSSGYYGDTNGRDGSGGYLQLTDSSPSGIGIRAGVDKAVRALASARKSEAHQADAAAARLQRLKEQRTSRRRSQQEQGSGGKRPHRQRESQAAAAAAAAAEVQEQQRKNCPRHIADASAGEQARAQAETRARGEIFARERVLHDERALVKAYRSQAAAKEGPQTGAYDSRAARNNHSSAMQGAAGKDAGCVPTVAGDGFLNEASIGGGGRRERVRAQGSQRQGWRDGDGQNADTSGALAQWNW